MRSKSIACRLKKRHCSGTPEHSDRGSYPRQQAHCSGTVYFSKGRNLGHRNSRLSCYGPQDWVPPGATIGPSPTTPSSGLIERPQFGESTNKFGKIVDKCDVLDKKCRQPTSPGTEENWLPSRRRMGLPTWNTRLRARAQRAANRWPRCGCTFPPSS